MTTASFYVKRTFADFFGNVHKVDFIGPYLESQEYAVGLQRGADERRQKPAKVQITKWEWVQGKDA